ncbi:MAG TPA: hypothetical protein VGC08_06065 [Pedobacter sp.]
MIITIDGTLQSDPKFASFKLVYTGTGHFSIVYQDKGTVYNFGIKL